MCVFLLSFSVDLRVFFFFFCEREKVALIRILYYLKSYRIQKKEQGLFTIFVQFKLHARMGVLFSDFSTLTGNFPFLEDFLCVVECFCVLCAKQHFFHYDLS